MTVNDPALVNELREWARGSLPLMAAVDFVVATGTALGPMIGQEHGRAFLALFVDDERAPYTMTTEQWHARVGGMSGGQRATWELARSIAAGELNEWFWRLDAHRKFSFVTALLSTAYVVDEQGRLVAS